MLYKKEGITYSRESAINSMILQLGSVVQPSYIEDETLALYGFVLDKDYVPQQNLATKEDRKKVLASVDWVSGAKHLTKATKDAVEAWRSVVRDCPNCAIIPPLPELVATKTKSALPLSELEVDLIKNYVTKDDSWLLFLQTWKDLGFPDSRNIVSNLLIAYTKVRLNEVISSI